MSISLWQMKDGMELNAPVDEWCKSRLLTSFHISYITLNENHIIEPAELAEQFVRIRTRSSGRAHQEFFWLRWLDHSGVLEVVGSILTWKYENIFLHSLPSNHHFHISWNTYFFKHRPIMISLSFRPFYFNLRNEVFLFSMAFKERPYFPFRYVETLFPLSWRVPN